MPENGAYRRALKGEDGVGDLGVVVGDDSLRGGVRAAEVRALVVQDADEASHQLGRLLLRQAGRRSGGHGGGEADGRKCEGELHCNEESAGLKSD